MNGLKRTLSLSPSGPDAGPFKLRRPEQDKGCFEEAAMEAIEFIDRENEGSFATDIERIKGLGERIASLEAKEREHKQEAESEESLVKKGLRCVEKLGISNRLVLLKSERLNAILRVMEMMECDLCVAPESMLRFNVGRAQEIHAKWQKINEERLENDDSPLEHARQVLGSFEPNFLRFFFAVFEEQDQQEDKGVSKEETPLEAVNKLAATALATSPSDFGALGYTLHKINVLFCQAKADTYICLDESVFRAMESKVKEAIKKHDCPGMCYQCSRLRQEMQGVEQGNHHAKVRLTKHGAAASSSPSSPSSPSSRKRRKCSSSSSSSSGGNGGAGVGVAASSSRNLLNSVD
ncbi:MAG: hypothetical protein CMI26_14735 [Opitutae bacterium]|nr:hypothetical protein [Opitutae bacterium]|tara:strand:- start:271 stop:1320 length:1050 start_codon:yes stop_codon:yes gene_type:complete